MNGGDEIPGVHNVEFVSQEVALKTMIRSLRNLEKSIKSERDRLTQELKNLERARAEALTAQALLIEANSR